MLEQTGNRKDPKKGDFVGLLWANGQKITIKRVLYYHEEMFFLAIRILHCDQLPEMKEKELGSQQNAQNILDNQCRGKETSLK